MKLLGRLTAVYTNSTPVESSMDDPDAENAADFEMKEIDKQGHNQKLHVLVLRS